MKKFRCAREFIEQFLTNKFNELSFEMFATGVWDTEFPDDQKTKIYEDFLTKLSQLGKRGINKIYDINNLCMKLNEKVIDNKSVFSISFYEHDTKEINLMFLFKDNIIKIVNLKTSLPFKERNFKTWQEVKELFA